MHISEGRTSLLRRVCCRVNWDVRGIYIALLQTLRRMSFFSTALTRIWDRNQLRQADVVRDSGLTRSHVSRLVSGEQRTITDEDFVSLLKAYRDKRDQAELTAARCMDVRVGPAAGLVEINVKTPGAAKATS